jgi:hypothetical protein
MLGLTTLQAATEVQWLDLQSKIGHGKKGPDGREDRQYRVVTKDAHTHVGYKIIFTSADVRVADTDPAIPREQVKEIRVRRAVSFWDALFGPAAAFFSASGAFDNGGGGSWDFGIDPVQIIFLLPVALAVTAVAAPFALPSDAVKRFRPDKVFRVAP